MRSVDTLGHGNAPTRRDFLKGVAVAGGLALLPQGGSASAVEGVAVAPVPTALKLGHAVHAFEHLGAYAGQAEAAAASGATIIYATGLGGAGYTGLPGHAGLETLMSEVRDYNANARAKGVEVVLGYLCATSIVKLDTFDAGWSDALRAAVGSTPSAWLQQGRDGKPLPSWYGGDYRPACMNHPDWRAYQRHMTELQLATDHDGIFFDNPTVHPEGCYCAHCMKAFMKFMGREEEMELEAMRALADRQTEDFLRFRATIARDFLGHIREHARKLNPNALITANNSTNQPTVLYSQCRNYGYSPFEMSRTEDFVVLEDMATQPRTTDEAKVFEYAPTYKQAQALCHGKPLVAVTIAEGDYHTPPNLVRLAFAEAFAHNASYLVWTTWPEEQRARMIASTRETVDFFRKHQELLQDAQPVVDAMVFLPMRRFVDTDHCVVSDICAELGRSNTQYGVFCEEDFDQGLAASRVLVVESKKVLSAEEHAKVDRFRKEGGVLIEAAKSGWLQQLAEAITTPAVRLEAPATVRVALLRQQGRLIIHLLNLDVRRRSSFEDEVYPASDVRLLLRRDLSPTESFTLHVIAKDSVTLPRVPSKKDPRYDVVTVPLLDVNALIVA